MMETAQELGLPSNSPLQSRCKKNPGRTIGLVAGAAILLQLLAPSRLRAQDGDVAFEPLKIFSYIDMGQIVKGADRAHPRDDGSIPEVNGYFLSNIGIAILTEAAVKDNLHLKVGVGGLFWYPYPNVSSDPASRSISFGPGISEASFRYEFRENLSLKMGFIGYKYNADAQNLGEYLFRSEAYPHFVKTGGWSWINSAYQSLGLHLNLVHLRRRMESRLPRVQRIRGEPCIRHEPRVCQHAAVGENAGTRGRHLAAPLAARQAQ